jgi:UDP-N-acetylglucosamine 2-epimerase
MRIVSIVGARPQYIKLAPLHQSLIARHIDHQVINTGQHYDYRMAGVFFKELSLPKPRYDLEVGSGSASEMVARVIERAAAKLRALAPELVVVYGDTNSTLGAALAAAQLNLPLAHVEAGLRCFDMRVPEELNRVIADRISRYLFCPTPQSVANLKAEGLVRGVFTTGDLLYDVLRQSLPPRHRRLQLLQQQELDDRQFLFLTLHRSDSVDNKDKLSRLVAMICSLKETTLFPIHPRTRKRLLEFGLWKTLNGNRHLKIIEPLGYPETLALLASCLMALTDSGGIQREAYYLKVPTLLLRDVTEWVEIQRSGGSYIVGLDQQKLHTGLTRHRFDFSNRSICRSGAAERIATRLARLSR